MKTDRREFLKYGLITSSLFLGTMYAVRSGKKTGPRELDYPGNLIDQSERGHKLRAAINVPPSRSEKVPVLIVGGGVTGLLTGYYLKQSGFNNFKILEMNDEIGGNSAYGQNLITSYPWGAHYIPLPNPENRPLIDFCIKMGLATEDPKTLKLDFFEENLCHDPQERLFIKGEWQESLLPSKNITSSETAQLKRFHELVEIYKYKRGRDKKFAFDIPVMESSQDPEFLSLDNITFADFLKSNGLRSEAMDWYMNYCTLDDYGMGIDTVSAWAGMHYFCSRRPLGQYDDHKIMTWPEGNGFIVKKLMKILLPHIQANCAVTRVISDKNKPVKCHVFNFENSKMTEFESKQLVFAAPQFLSKYLFANKELNPDVSADDYYSWLVANITVNLTPAQFQALHWDNVRYGMESLGYVHARHQELRGRPDSKTVLTLYWPLYAKDMSATDIRKKISTFKWNDWAPKVERELEALHPGIATSIEKMDIKIHGHAMIGPKLGRMKKVFSGQWKVRRNENVFFAHTDNSGMSLFEEAHYWAHKVAREIVGG